MVVPSPAVRVRTLSAGALFWLCAAGTALACDTPVYRYAMYRWAPAPYEVYCFHNQPLSDGDQRVAALLKASVEDTERPANVVYIPLNLAEDKELKRIPPDIRQAFLAHESPPLPAYLVATPFGMELFFGQLDEAAVRELLDSPARQDMAGQLAAGKAGVFVFIPGSDAAANERAESVLKELIQDVQAGKIELYTGLPPAPPAAGTDAQPAPPTLELGLVRVERGDAKEVWLRRSLWAMEPNLEKEDVPMVFMTYGRARVSLPYLGEGISRENLLGEVYFITGACSCTVKEQNPGMDLLVQRNWEQAAMQLAEKFGAEEGNPYGSGTFFPELVIPSGSTSAANAAASGATEGAGAVAKPDAPETTAAEPAASAPPSEPPSAPVNPAAAGDSAAGAPAASFPSAEPAESPTATETDSNASPGAEAPAYVSAPATVESGADVPSPAREPQSATIPSGASAFQSVWVVGGVVVVGLVVLLALTFSVLRPH